MENTHADQLRFRHWLVKQLKTTRWSAISGESRALLADRLGISLAVLEEAQRQRQRTDELKLQGKVTRQLGNRAVYRHEYAVLDVTMPPVVYAAWQELCKSFGVELASSLSRLEAFGAHFRKAPVV